MRDAYSGMTAGEAYELGRADERQVLVSFVKSIQTNPGDLLVFSVPPLGMDGRDPFFSSLREWMQERDVTALAIPAGMSIEQARREMLAWCSDGRHVVEHEAKRCICGLIGVTQPNLEEALK